MLSILQVHKGDNFYKQGRSLAENVYRQVWGTENLLDHSDYGVVILENDKVLGNINIQFKRSGKLLRSEAFFGERHWQNYSDVHPPQIAEFSALAIAQDAPKELRRSIMISLMLGLFSICDAEDIELVTTVQHDYLIRILSKSLRLPFFANQYSQKCYGELPNDNYWNRSKLPIIYYILPNSTQTVNACNSYALILSNVSIERSSISNLKVGINELRSKLSSSLSTTAKIGEEPSIDSIRVGTVKMEEHPDYPSLINDVQSRGFTISEDIEAYVHYVEIVDRNLKIIDIEREIHVITSMRFIDLEHEIGHLQQLERFNFEKYTDRFKQSNDGRRKLFNRNAPHVLQEWQNIVMEYHNRLDEFLRLYKRNASPQLLLEHSSIDTIGIAYWERLYSDKIFNKGRGRQKIKWVEQYFPDMRELKAQYDVAIEELKRIYPDIDF